MKFSFFESLSEDEAREYFEEFLAFGKNRAIQILESNLHFTVDLDFEINSLANVFKVILPCLRTIPRGPDPNIPSFIRETDSYKKNLFDFAEEAKPIILSSAYYLGETFVRKFTGLSWGIGDRDYALGNMPVVKGFKYSLEMPILLIAENIFGRIISEMGDESSIDLMIETWKKNIPD